MTWTEVFADNDRTILRRHHLVEAGATSKSLTAAVANGFLVRVMRDHYALPDTQSAVLKAVRVGGRLCCVSAIAKLGIFAFDTSKPHIHLKREASRSRSPHSRFVALAAENRSEVILHWSPLVDEHDGNEFCVGIIDSLVQAVRCQQPAHAVATLDNALFLGRISEADLALVFRRLPLRLRYLHELVDGRAEAGQETVLRLLLRSAGLSYELQVVVDGVGRVDILVEGVLVLEADSRLAHDGWEKHVVDRWRDVQLARRHYMSLRPAYQHTMFHPEQVLEAVLALLDGWGIRRPRP
jgi:hypothetical protein